MQRTVPARLPSTRVHLAPVATHASARAHRASSRLGTVRPLTAERAIAVLRGGFAVALLAATVVHPPTRAWVAYLAVGALIAGSATVLRLRPRRRLPPLPP